MAIILPKTKIRDRTGWTESVTADSSLESEWRQSGRLPGAPQEAVCRGRGGRKVREPGIKRRAKD